MFLRHLMTSRSNSRITGRSEEGLSMSFNRQTQIILIYAASTQYAVRMHSLFYTTGSFRPPTNISTPLARFKNSCSLNSGLTSSSSTGRPPSVVPSSPSPVNPIGTLILGKHPTLARCLFVGKGVLPLLSHLLQYQYDMVVGFDS